MKKYFTVPVEVAQNNDKWEASCRGLGPYTVDSPSRQILIELIPACVKFNTETNLMFGAGRKNTTIKVKPLLDLNAFQLNGRTKPSQIGVDPSEGYTILEYVIIVKENK